VGGFGGGLEHRASVTIAVADRPGLEISSLAAHEFFHLWNVKRIRPKILGPFDYTGPQRTKNLWFAEGVTSYYADLALYRARMVDRGGLLSSIVGTIQQLDRSGDRKRYTAEDASWHAWEGGSIGYGNLSYYDKGYVIGLLLDLAIRTRSGGAKSLDDVMRYLFHECAPPKPGYDENGILAAINTVTGSDLTQLYDRMVRSTEELPYAEIFTAAGLDYVGPGADADPGFGTWLPGMGAYPHVADLYDGGAGSRMGAEAGDTILRVNDADVRGQSAPLAAIKSGDKFTMDVLRHGKAILLTGTMGTRHDALGQLAVAARLTQLQRRVLDGWLRR
jgi:predicted metalloprotease with PDZ domain